MSNTVKSNTIYYMKAIAVFSVVCAHISVVPDTFSPASQFVCNGLSEIGAIGVGIFFAISGYLFNSEKIRKLNFREMLFNKVLSIGIPWLISATLVYLYVAIRKGGRVSEYFLRLLGYQSSYWYLTVLMIMFVLFFLSMKIKKEILISIILSLCTVLSFILRMYGYIPQNALGVYLNIFNWTIFFSIGFLMPKESVRKISSKLALTVLITMGFVIFALLLYFHRKSYFLSYYSYIYVPIEILIIIFVFALCKILNKYNIRILAYIGRLSFCIYLYNDLLWAGLMVNLGSRIDIWPLLLLRPIIVIIMVCFEMEIARAVFKRINKEPLFCRLAGIR